MYTNIYLCAKKMSIFIKETTNRNTFKLYTFISVNVKPSYCMKYKSWNTPYEYLVGHYFVIYS